MIAAMARRPTSVVTRSVLVDVMDPQRMTAGFVSLITCPRLLVLKLEEICVIFSVGC